MNNPFTFLTYEVITVEDGPFTFLTYGVIQVENGTFTFLTDEVFVPLAVDVRPVASVLGLLRDDHTVLKGQVVWL